MQELRRNFDSVWMRKSVVVGVGARAVREALHSKETW